LADEQAVDFYVNPAARRYRGLASLHYPQNTAADDTAYCESWNRADHARFERRVVGVISVVAIVSVFAVPVVRQHSK
jgi:hypothetical protein